LRSLLRLTLELAQVLGLNVEQACFDYSGAAQPPEEARQSQHKVALDHRTSIVICRNGFSKAL
jgi:hypothetical protein